MKLVAQAKLLTEETAADRLRTTMQKVNFACNRISEYAWEQREFRHHPLYRALYRDIKTNFQLPAQLAIEAIAKVVEAYAIRREERVRFAPLSPIRYGSRSLTWRLLRASSSVSLDTLEQGRLKVPIYSIPRHLDLLVHQRGDIYLVHHQGMFFLFALCWVEQPDPEDFVLEFDISNGPT